MTSCVSIFPPAVFTLHAHNRLRDRGVSLTSAEVVRLLDGGKTVSLGVEGGRVHRMFYSEPDNRCFIAVQDEDNGEIVTIAHPTQTRLCGYSPRSCEMARELILGPRENRASSTRSSKKKRIQVHFDCIAQTPSGRTRRVRLDNILSTMSGRCLEDLDLEQDERVALWVVQRIKECVISRNLIPVSVSARLGSGADRVEYKAWSEYFN